MLSWIKDKIKGVKSQDQCIFCQIQKPFQQNGQHKKTKEQFLYQDQKYFAIHDISKASAQQHILVLTKAHIRSVLQIKDKQTILDLQQIAQKVLNKLSEQSKFKEQSLKQTEIIKIAQNNENKEESKGQKCKNKYRFGFHLPPYNSIDHIHLHGFLLPFQNWKSNSLTYGWMMNSVEDVLNMIK